MQDSMYRGDKPFTRDQLVFVVEAILAGCLDLMEMNLPHNDDYDGRAKYVDRQQVNQLTSHEHAWLDATGVALSVFVAQLTEGITGHECLMAADNFHHQVAGLFHNAWFNRETAQKFKSLTSHGARSFSDIYKPNWPNCRRSAERLVTMLFAEYLGIEPTRTVEFVVVYQDEGDPAWEIKHAEVPRKIGTDVKSLVDWADGNLQVIDRAAVYRSVLAIDDSPESSKEVNSVA